MKENYLNFGEYVFFNLIFFIHILFCETYFFYRQHGLLNKNQR